MQIRRTVLLALAGALAAGPVAAQSAGTVELGIFGRWTKFGDGVKFDTANNGPAKNAFGGGVRLGVFLARNLALEVDGAYTKTDGLDSGKVRHIPVHAGLTYNIPLGKNVAFLLGGRYVYNNYGNDADFSDHGIGALAGFRFGPLRIDGTFDQVRTQNVDRGRYHNWGVQAGFSALLGNCRKSEDGVTITPTTVTLNRGERATFSASATRCGKSADVVYSATGGSINEGGEYTAGMSPGSYLVTATEPKSGLTSTAAVRISEPPPPPPPAPVVRLTRIDLTPDRARVRMMESVAFTVLGINSDGTNRTLSNCSYTATGNATQAGNSFSWGRPGNYTVSVQCEGMSDQSSVEVPLEIIIFGTNFAFNSDKLTPAGLDSVRAGAEELKKYPEIKIRLGGHADFVGSDAYNCNLSWRRVHSVHLALNRFGISDDRFSAIEGFGEAYPVPDDQVTQEMRDMNTRQRDKGKYWDRRVLITSSEKPAGQMACPEPKR